MSKRKFLWFLSVPVVLGGYALYKNIDKVKKIKFDKLKPLFKKTISVSDKAFDVDEKSLRVIKSHITRNLNLKLITTNFFAFGIANTHNFNENTIEAKEAILLVKSKDEKVIRDLLLIYKQKHEDTPGMVDVEDNISTSPKDDNFYFVLYFG